MERGKASADVLSFSVQGNGRCVRECRGVGVMLSVLSVESSLLCRLLSCSHHSLSLWSNYSFTWTS